MFEFEIEGYRIGDVVEDEKIEGYASDQLMDSKEVTLKDIVTHTENFLIMLERFVGG